MVEDFLYQSPPAALSSQPLASESEAAPPAHVLGKHKGILVSHHAFQNIRQAFRFVSVVERTPAPWKVFSDIQYSQASSQ